MAQPLQYQSQFVPTDFNTVGNILGMYRQDMQQRNQEFDQGKMMESKALAELYGTKTYDQDVINEQANRLKQQIEESVKKRGMDYGAAAGDIASLIAQEQSNPIWGLNQRKVEQAKALEEMLQRNPNLRVLQDPTKISLSQKGLRPDDIKYSVVDPEEYRKALAQQTKGWDSKRTPLGMKNVNGYDTFQTQIGLSDADVNKFAMDKNNFMKSLSSMGNYDEIVKNPQVVESLYNDYVSHMQGLSQGITQTMGMSPRDKLSMQMMVEERNDKANQQQEYNIGFPAGNTPDPVAKIFESSKEVFNVFDSSKPEEFKLNQAKGVVSRVLESDRVKVPEKYMMEFGKDNFLGSLNEKINVLSKEVNEAFDSSKGMSMAHATPEQRKEYAQKMKSSNFQEKNKELRELNKIKSDIQDAIDVDLTTQGDDMYVPMRSIDPMDSRRRTAFDAYSKNLSLENAVFLTGDFAGGDAGDREGADWEALQSGFELVSGGHSTDNGHLFKIRATGGTAGKGKGKEYTMKFDDPSINQALMGFLNPQASVLRDDLNDVDFQGNLMKTKNGNMKLPFSVKNYRQDGKHYYEIEGLTMADYYTPQMRLVEQQLIEKGASEEDVDYTIRQMFPQLFEKDKVTGKIMGELPFKTRLKEEILDYAKLSNQ